MSTPTRIWHIPADICTWVMLLLRLASRLPGLTRSLELRLEPFLLPGEKLPSSDNSIFTCVSFGMTSDGSPLSSRCDDSSSACVSSCGGCKSLLRRNSSEAADVKAWG